MAVINRNTLVLTGVSVVSDVVTVTMGNGLNPACAELSRSPISTRHPSQKYPQAEQMTGQRLDHADSGMDDAAHRAGRPGCRAGLLASRGLALPASLTSGGACSTAATRIRQTAILMAPADMRLPGRHLPSFVMALRTSRLPRSAAKAGHKQAKAGLAWRKPAGGALSASTRG
jgi:hypothetical protein